MTTKEQEALGEWIGGVIGFIGVFALLRRFGASKWQAYAVTLINAQLGWPIERREKTRTVLAKALVRWIEAHKRGTP